MNKKITPEEAKRLLTAIFAKGEEKDPNEMTSAELEDATPKTLKDKVSEAEYTLIYGLGNISSALMRLTRLGKLLLISEKSGGLPDIITHNELHMALRPLRFLQEDIDEIVEMLQEAVNETKPTPKEDKEVQK